MATSAGGLESVGLGSHLGRAAMESSGFHVRDADLEDELIRTRIIRILQCQPAQRARSREAQLHRFIGTRSGRKARYARLLVEALDLASTPRPLDRVLEVGR